MSRPVRPPVFLERRSYRRRRMMDAARVLPILGAVLFMLPMLWHHPDAQGTATGSVRTSYAYVYLFALWAGLILLSGLLSRNASTWRGDESSADRSREI